MPSQPWLVPRDVERVGEDNKMKASYYPHQADDKISRSHLILISGGAEKVFATGSFWFSAAAQAAALATICEIEKRFMRAN